MAEQLLDRKLGAGQAVAINMTDMVGIGPFITMPMVIGMMNGPWFLYAWIAGAFLSIVDAMIWSELGAAFPRAGGSYNFLKEAYGVKSGGKLMSFLFVWQTLIQAPLVIASAAIGFAKYFSYLVSLNAFTEKLVSASVVILIILLLYRRIETIGKISIFLWSGVFITIFWIIAAGFSQGNFFLPVREMHSGLSVDYAFVTAIGFASVKSVYSYLGYYNICHLGSEIKDPARNIPRSMFISIAAIAVMYLLMNISVVSVIPWSQAKDSEFVVSEFMNVVAGPLAAKIITCLILWVAFASVFSATLGYSRIPFAAASDGEFFPLFAKLHPTKNFPHFSLLFLGTLAFIFSLLFKLSDVISAILAMRIMIQFIGQGIGLLILRRKRNKDFFPWRMPLFPVPVLLAIAMWLFILISTGLNLVIGGFIVIFIGLMIYMIKARYNGEWPFPSKRKLNAVEDATF